MAKIQLIRNLEEEEEAAPQMDQESIHWRETHHQLYQVMWRLRLKT